MDIPLSYFPQGMAVLDRLRSLYEDRPQDRIFARMGTPSRAIEAFAAQYEPGYCEYPDPAERVAFWDVHLQERAAVEDDSMPSAYLAWVNEKDKQGMVYWSPGAPTLCCAALLS